MSEKLEKVLNKDYWQHRYVTDQTGWDIGSPSPALVEYVKQVDNKSAKILIPGAGNAHEVKALLDADFENIRIIDIASQPIENLKQKFSNDDRVTLIEGDFFEMQGHYDIILEQTFFCALTPDLRRKYVEKMYDLLNEGGTLAGVLFNTEFEKEGPPFGGNIEEYQNLFQDYFDIKTMDTCHNSIPPRAGNEVFIIMKKNNNVINKIDK